MEGMLTTDMEVRGSSSTVVTVSGGGETTLDTLFSVVKKGVVTGTCVVSITFHGISVNLNFWDAFDLLVDSDMGCWVAKVVKSVSRK